MRQILAILFLVGLFQFNGLSQQSGWKVISLGTSSELNSIHFLDPFDLYICGDILLNVTSPDSGSTWQVNSFQPPVVLNDIAVLDSNTAVSVGNGGMTMRSTDGGVNWTAVSSGVTDDLLSVSFIDSFGICGGLSQTILYTSDGGESWDIAQSGFFGGGFWGAIMLSPQIGFIAGENSILQPLLGQTSDAGQHWNFNPFYLDNNEGRATGVDFTDMFVGYMSARVWDGRGAIAKTTDSGSNWVTTFFNDPLWSIDFPISNASQVGYAVGDLGVILKTYDAGISWQPQQSGTAFKLNKVYFSDFETGYVVGESGVMLRTTTGGEPVTKMRSTDLRVNEFNLKQNYPNPFNPITSIRYKIPFMRGNKRNDPVALRVYDLLGNEIATLVNENKPAGEYEIGFNASQLASGVYLYRLSTGSFTQTRRMIVLK